MLPWMLPPSDKDNSWNFPYLTNQKNIVPAWTDLCYHRFSVMIYEYHSHLIASITIHENVLQSSRKPNEKTILGTMLIDLMYLLRVILKSIHTKYQHTIRTTIVSIEREIPRTRSMAAWTLHWQPFSPIYFLPCRVARPEDWKRDADDDDDRGFLRMTSSSSA